MIYFTQSENEKDTDSQNLNADKFMDLCLKNTKNISEKQKILRIFTPVTI